jgi:regulatory protein
MIITKIEQQKRHPDRVNVYLDGEFALGLHKDVVGKYALRKGDNIDQSAITKLTSSDEFASAKSKALRFISRRMHAEKELRAKLIEREYHPKIVDEVIVYLRSIDFVNDEKFAKAFVNDFQLRKPAGRRLLQQQLHLKGISSAIIQNVLGETNENHEYDTALQAAMKKLDHYKASKKKLEPQKQQQRIVQFLQRRGFVWSIISPVLKKIFNNYKTQSEE